MKWLIFLLIFPITAYADAGDIVFVGQVPWPFDFANFASTFGNHRASTNDAPRGGDLFIRYSNGSIKNLTRLAGYGRDGFQGTNGIAVRDPAVHWSGTKVIFSMVIGGVANQYEVKSFRWQLYEVTGLGIGETPVITKVLNQPAGYNNVMPTYATDDQIIFATDRPRGGEAHLYPQLDEYESTATPTGLWKLNPSNGALILLDHTPSGAFHPVVDSFGRVIYTRWDHLQRDQQNLENNPYGARNFSSEAANAVNTGSRAEVFPESRDELQRTSPFLNLHTMNQFFPWMINEDGTDHETLNHIGRHEFVNYFDRTFNNDPNLNEYLGSLSKRANVNYLAATHQLREDPLRPGRYLGINCPEFATHASGQIVAVNGAPSINPRDLTVDFLTHPDTAGTTATGSHTGMYRNPLPLMNGTLVAAHTTAKIEDANIGSSSAPLSRYDYRLKVLSLSGQYYVPGTPLTSGLPVNVSWWDPDKMVSYTGNLWEIQPVELISRAKPQPNVSHVPDIEKDVLNEEGMPLAELQNYLRQHNLALIIGRDVTTRDAADVQQPYNLRVAGGVAETIAKSGKIYDVSHLQIFQGDLIRGYSNIQGRRVIAQPMHDIPNPGPNPQGAVKIAADGSIAALVPAQRALTWELTNNALPDDQKGIVRERYWLTFQPGEVRVCTSCHGLNTVDQKGQGVPMNKPEALREMIRFVKDLPDHPTPAPTPAAPNFKVSVKGKDSKNRSSSSKIAPKKAYSIDVRRTNSETVSLQLALKFQIDGKNCKGTPKKISMNSSGRSLVGGKAPSSRRDAKVNIQLTYGGKVKVSKAITLLNSERSSAKRKAKFSSKEIEQICRGLGQR